MATWLRHNPKNYYYNQGHEGCGVGMYTCVHIHYFDKLYMMRPFYFPVLLHPCLHIVLAMYVQ
jgi:hypothetical protein